MNKKILTITLNPCIDKTLTIKGFKYGGLNRVEKIRTDVGGKGINVSKVLRNFDTDVFACGIVAGKQGREIIEFLNNNSIPNLMTYAEGETRTNYKIVDIESRITTEINEPGFYVNQDVLEKCIENIKKMLPLTEIMILSGSLPPGASDDIYKRLIEIAKNYDVKVILDADSEKLKRGIEASPYAIKPNLFEFEQLVGTKLDSHEKIISAAKKYIKMGAANIIIISMGAEGAFFISDSVVYLATPFKIECKSTVGAGDSMVAALAYGLQKGYDFKTIACMAVAAGTITASKEGSDVCTLKEVMENMHYIQIKDLTTVVSKI